jgi:hypothetical protein
MRATRPTTASLGKLPQTRASHWFCARLPSFQSVHGLSRRTSETTLEKLPLVSTKDLEGHRISAALEPL